jgi:phosphohistidine phosphatase
MSRLLLFRHAKARWAEPGARDFDRALEPSGRHDAAEIGKAMRRAGYLPALTICSTALRARETLEAAAGQWGAERPDIVFSDILYSGDAAGYLHVIREAAASAPALVIGHNPMIEDLAMALAGDGGAKARARLKAGFPTAGLAVLSFEDGLGKAAPGNGYLEAFLVPG